MQVQSLPQEDPLEKKIVFLPGKSMDRGDWQATDHGVTKESDMTGE